MQNSFINDSFLTRFVNNFANHSGPCFVALILLTHGFAWTSNFNSVLKCTHKRNLFNKIQCKAFEFIFGRHGGRFDQVFSANLIKYFVEMVLNGNGLQFGEYVLYFFRINGFPSRISTLNSLSVISKFISLSPIVRFRKNCVPLTVSYKTNFS